MAEDFGDKTEAPTPRRRQEAREQGNIARSQDLTAAVLIIGAMILLNAYGPGLVTALKALVREMLSERAMQNLDGVSVLPDFLRAVVLAGGALAPLLIGVVLIAVLCNIVQVGFHLNGKRLAPNLMALNPFKGFGKIFGKGRSGMQLVMNVAKLLLVGFAAYSAVHDRLAQIVMVQQLEYLQIFGLGAELIYGVAIRIGVMLLVLAIADYLYQRFRIEKELKMSKQEVKEEMRRMEGDPKIKQRRRQIALQVATQRLNKDVTTADVIVTNPTEFAIALKYDSTTMHAPRVVAKGQGLLAQRIREIAIANGIPILERKPLARALFKLIEVGQEIPEQFYSAVAEILAYVYELSGRLKQRQAV